MMSSNINIIEPEKTNHNLAINDNFAFQEEYDFLS